MTLNTLSLTIESPQVYTKRGVAIYVTGIAQVSFCSHGVWGRCYCYKCSLFILFRYQWCLTVAVAEAAISLLAYLVGSLPNLFLFAWFISSSAALVCVCYVASFACISILFSDSVYTVCHLIFLFLQKVELGPSPSYDTLIKQYLSIYRLVLGCFSL